MSNKGQFAGKVQEGKLELYNAAGFQALLKNLEGKQVVLSLGARKKTRSDNQNRYMWGVVLKVIGDDLGYTQEELHEALKWKFLRVEAGERALPTIRSTASLNTDEFEDYLDRIRMWAASEMGIVVPLPGEDL